MEGEESTAAVFRSIGLTNEKIQELLSHLEILTNTETARETAQETAQETAGHVQPQQRMEGVQAQLTEIEVALKLTRTELEQHLTEDQPHEAAEEVLSPEEARRLLGASKPQHSGKGRRLYAESKAAAARELADIEKSMERIMSGSTAIQLEKQVRFRTHQLETMERELSLKKTLLDKKISEKLHHANSLKQTFNEAAHAHKRQLLENIAAKQCEIDVLETEMLASHQEIMSLRKTTFQRLFPHLSEKDETTAAELHQMNVMEQQASDLLRVLHPLVRSVIDLDGQAQGLRETKYKLEHQIMQLVVFQESNFDLEDYSKLSQLEDARVEAEQELVRLNKQIADAKTQLEATQQDYRQMIAIKQLSQQRQYESVVHAEELRMQEGLTLSSGGDSDLEALVDANRRYHRLAVLQLAERVSGGQRGDRETTARALEALRHASLSLSSSSNGQRRGKSRASSFDSCSTPDPQRQRQQLLCKSSVDDKDIGELQNLDHSLREPVDQSSNAHDQSTADPTSHSTNDAAAVEIQTADVQQLLRAKEAMQMEVQQLREQVDELQPLEAQAQMHLELDLRSQRLAANVLQTRISYLEQQLLATPLGEQLLAGCPYHPSDDEEVWQLEHDLLDSIAQLVERYNSMTAVRLDSGTVAMRTANQLAAGCILDALAMLSSPGRDCC